MTLPMFTQPGQVSGAQLGNAIFKFLPSLPGEGPPFMPRALAKALFPQGFVPGMIPQAAPTMAPPVTLIPPAAPAAPPVVPAPAADARGNQIQRRQPMPAAPVPRKRVLERGTFPEWH